VSPGRPDLSKVFPSGRQGRELLFEIWVFDREVVGLASRNPRPQAAKRRFSLRVLLALPGPVLPTCIPNGQRKSRTSLCPPGAASGNPPPPPPPPKALPSPQVPSGFFFLAI